MECRTTRPAADAGLPTHPGNPLKISESSNQRYWIPGKQGLDPRCMETAPHRDKAIGPGTPDEDQGLCGSQDYGIQDYAGPGTSWDSRLRKTQDFVGSRTSQKTGTLHARTRILFCGVLSENTRLSG